MEHTKLFIGQIPKTLNEDELTPIFAPFGTIIELAVIRDKSTKQHKGCAFLTYSSKAEAEACIATLHNNHQFPGMPSPLQVKHSGTADERTSENKLFVGMLPRTSTEEELMPMFLPFGEIIEFTILKGPDRTSKGCAFLRYKDISSASAAIKALDGVVKLPGSPSNLVVKFAESAQQRQKQAPQANPLGALSALANPMLLSNPAYWQLAQQQLANQYAAFLNPAAGAGTTGAAATLQAQLSALAGGGFGGLGGASGVAALAAAYGLGGGSGASSGLGGAASLYGLGGGMGGTANALGSNKEGPQGANLFIYHLPREYTDADLMSLFSPFGSILSCKVITEKDTGISKGYGFVSYETADSASLAISQMNGFQVAGGRRLKVEVKTKAGVPSGAGGGFRPY